MAVDAADPSGRSGDGKRPVRPDGKVRMVPLPGEGDGADDGKGTGSGRDGAGDTKGVPGGRGADEGRTGAGEGTDGSADGAKDGAQATGSSSSASPDGPGADGSNSADSSETSTPGSGTGDGGQHSGGGSSEPEPGPGSPDSPGSPSGPAVLTASEPDRAKADDRWCEKVTVRFTNSGGRTVSGGKITFGTHIVDALGIDWATRESTRALPVPIKAGEKKEKTWTVCVDAWRDPLGMHIETRDVRLSGWR